MEFERYKARLEAILFERDSNPQAYIADGHVYFEEFEPLIQYALAELMPKPKPVVAKVEVKKVEKKVVKPAPKKVVVKKAVKVKTRRSR